jgi:hypothetical protein
MENVVYFMAIWSFTAIFYFFPNWHILFSFGAGTKLTSSTHAQKWSSALGWMSPHVRMAKKSSFGSDIFSRLTKYTPWGRFYETVSAETYG